MTDAATPESSPSLPEFNLLDSPWVPVRYLDGSTDELGLLDVFDRAAQIEGLAETSPPNLVALYRVLLAITHRALTLHLGRWTDRDRARWYAQGLPSGAVADYLTHWRDRFWLFHPQYPFMQVAALATAGETRDKLKPWTQIALASANGNNPVMFDHSLDTEPVSIDCAAALRHLIGTLQFVAGGPVKVLHGHDKAGPLCNSAAAIPVGKNLAQTLLLALHPATTAIDEDRPSWERAALSIANIRGVPSPPTGCCDRYTRLTRAVLLVAEGGAGTGTIKWIRFAEGAALDDDKNAPDSMVSFRPGRKGLTKLTFIEGRALWRDLAALLPDASGNLAHPAATLTWATNLMDTTGHWDVYVPVLVAGQASTPGQMKILRTRSERYVLPTTALCQADVAQVLRTHLSRCDKLYRDLRAIATELLTQAMPAPAKAETKERARALLERGPFGSAFFASAERRLPGLLRLIGSADLAGAHTEWSAALLQAAHQAWDAARGMLGASAAALRAEAITHGKFLAAIKPLRPVSTTTQPEEATP